MTDITLADKLRGHVSRLASTQMRLSLIDWNLMSSDILMAADLLESAAPICFHKCQRCQETICDGEEPDGCRDPQCPELFA